MRLCLTLTEQVPFVSIGLRKDYHSVSLRSACDEWPNIRDKCFRSMRNFPGGPVVKTLHLHCREHGFDPSSGN